MHYWSQVFVDCNNVDGEWVLQLYIMIMPHAVGIFHLKVNLVMDYILRLYTIPPQDSWPNHSPIHTILNGIQAGICTLLLLKYLPNSLNKHKTLKNINMFGSSWVTNDSWGNYLCSKRVLWNHPCLQYKQFLLYFTYYIHYSNHLTAFNVFFSCTLLIFCHGWDIQHRS